MKVYNPAKVAECAFKELAPGDAFGVHWSFSVFIKMDKPLLEYNDGIMPNAVNLYSGEPAYFSDIEDIIPLKISCRVSIEKRRI